jgi:hypothetical protein
MIKLTLVPQNAYLGPGHKNSDVYVVGNSDF